MLYFSYTLRISFLHTPHSVIVSNNLSGGLFPHFTNEEMGRGKILVQNRRASYQSKTETQFLSETSSHICLKTGDTIT